MAIVFPVSKNHPGVSVSSFILDNYSVGKEVIAACRKGKYYTSLKERFAIGRMIRDFHGALGCGGNSKNGCLYREKGLPELWQKGHDPVVCDHAVPVTELVDQYKKHQSSEQIIKLIFSPVARISFVTDRRITAAGYAKNGFINGFPFSRYSTFNNAMIAQGGQPITIVNYKGEEIDLEKWTDVDHWKLVDNTPEFKPVLEEIKEALEKEETSDS